MAERDEGYFKAAADRVMIADLLARYAWELDHGSPERWAGLFAEYGIFEVAAMQLRVQGHAALADFARRLQQSMPGVHHVMSNLVIDLEGDRANVRCELNEFEIKDNAIVPTVQGRYEDEMVFADGRWLIAHRRVTAVFPDLSAVGTITQTP